MVNDYLERVALAHPNEYRRRKMTGGKDLHKK